MEKKFRMAFILIVFLGFFVPLDNGRIAAEFYLGKETLLYVFLYLIPDLLSVPVRYISLITESEQTLSDIIRYTRWTLGDFLRDIGTISWNLALPFLLVSNLFFLKLRSNKWKTVYRICLLVILVSSIYYSYRFSHPATHSRDDKYGGIGFWLNPILLIIATGLEVWFWMKERALKSKLQDSKTD